MLLKNYSITIERKAVVRTRFSVSAMTKTQAKKLAEKQASGMESWLCKWELIDRSQFGLPHVVTCEEMPAYPLKQATPESCW